MLKRKTVLVATVLMIGNVTVSLQAVPLRPPLEESGTSRGERLQNQVADRLAARGLEHSAAKEKAAKLFKGRAYAITTQLSHLHDRLEGTLDMEALENVLERRALFEQEIDLGTVGGLSGVVLEATGKAPDDACVAMLHEIAALNRIFDDRAA